MAHLAGTASMRKIPSGSAFRPTTGSRSLIPTSSIPCSTLFPQPHYSFAAGYTRVFSAESYELFQSGVFLVCEFVWPERLSANALGILDCVAGQRRHSLRLEGLTTLGYKAGEPLAHELRFGANTPMFLLNDCDFGQGTVPTVAYTTLPQFI
jgi:hypothetical protein